MRSVVYDFAALDEAGQEQAYTVAAAALSRGEVVWTQVHGVGCLIADAFSRPGVAAMLQARSRGRGAGLPVMVRDPAVVSALFADVDMDAQALMAAHWPGPLTLLGSPTSSLQWDLGAAGELVAVSVSMPGESAARELATRIGPCVYLRAHPDADTVETGLQAQQRLGDGVSVYLDAGATDLAATTPTTIVDVRGIPAVLLREGAVPVAVLRATCPGLVDGTAGQAAQ